MALEPTRRAETRKMRPGLVISPDEKNRPLGTRPDRSRSVPGGGPRPPGGPAWRRCSAADAERR
ncbi:MAG: hypothetical protein ACRD1A_11615 [Terriglobales bacterium]